MKKNKYIPSTRYKTTNIAEIVPGISKTVQGESYTVQELFERHMAGQVVDVQREAYWEDTQDFDAIDFDRLRHADPHEKAEMLRVVQEKAQRARLAIQQWEQDQIKTAFDKNADDTKEDTSNPPPKSKNQKGSKTASPGEQGSKRSGATDANSGDADTES